ncbi:hypothetical protein EDB85DRAFT_2154123 [Lactarius pseudohatsudake]|nr:hypothetical protein EDB85DRAFT_2154123 [Lactarius pseudohatsudake]
MYLEMVTEEDKKKAEGWKADADGILIITGLFSAAVASSILVSVQDIRPNPQDTSNFYLANIYQTLADHSLPTLLPLPHFLRQTMQSGIAGHIHDNSTPTTFVRTVLDDNAASVPVSMAIPDVPSSSMAHPFMSSKAWIYHRSMTTHMFHGRSIPLTAQPSIIPALLLP